ncbi:hypothetical protein ADK65_22795 [Streptomyces sp. NRRL B-1140]|uniref:hypothetical protein n=1 Tax=Streptomyces sp. NRRL B-1140 TaxID=1415549 RepID=UPI0006B03731|nr:hypothetical protein [Streptomyces sp. NRRL B-1140]KOV98498.1 hypothetical protein ADK65_22795 [Streptomyces sp. NRRL B-1140]
MRYIRHAKGALTVAAATAACHAVMSAGFAWSRDSATASGDTLFAGAFEFLFTMAASWTLMPLLLWFGMLVLRETGNTVFVLVTSLVWAGLSGYFTDDIDSAGGHIPIPALAAFVLLGTALAGAGDRPGDA